ncbi:MAG: right-handed parallel beta-helix repeat-containing protein [Planctomycetes bacterium]|nr:right-handed parallel beta-helix repeat-containing protein [Planctomycetota bacterium]
MCEEVKWLLAVAAMLLAGASASTAWEGVPRIDPDYKADVEAWWASHPFNPESPKYAPEIKSPQPVVSLAAGQSIQKAVAQLPPEGGTIKLAAGTYDAFTILGRSNVHIISDGEAVIHGHSYVSVCEEALDYGKMDRLVSHHPLLGDGYGAGRYADARVWKLYTNPPRNFYFKNLIFDGEKAEALFPGPGIQGKGGAIGLRRVYDVVFDNCVFRNFVNPRQGHGGLAWGHMGLNNVWFRGCHFVGDSMYAVYLDGAHGSGILNCTVEAPNFTGGFLFLTNHDFTDDINENGQMERHEERSAKYIIIYGNTFNGNCPGIPVAMTGDESLVTKNKCTGRALYFAMSCLPRPFAMASRTYGAMNMKIIGNTVGDCGKAFLRVFVPKSRLDEIRALPEARQYTIRDNTTGKVPQLVEYDTYGN